MSDVPKTIQIRGARVHNLQNIDLDLPRDQLIVFTGLSGSGKSSLAFDTIHAEGQRRYVESLSVKARAVLGQLEKPDVDYIEGLPPTLAIGQRTTQVSPRQSVSTATEIHDYLRLLFARCGSPHCPTCGIEVGRDIDHQIIERLLELPEGTKFQVLAPMVGDAPANVLLEEAIRQGFVRGRMGGKIRVLADVEESLPELTPVDVLVDRLVAKDGLRERLADAVETALQIGNGKMSVLVKGQDGELRFSESLTCNRCDLSFEPIDLRHFSYNSPAGACPTCDGLGTVPEFDEDLIIPDPNRSLREGAVRPWTTGRPLTGKYGKLLKSLSETLDFPLEAPFRNLSEDARRIIFHGVSPEDIDRYGFFFEGVIPELRSRYKKTKSPQVKGRLHDYMTDYTCSDCEGGRLRPEALAVTIKNSSIRDVGQMTIKEARAFFDDLTFEGENEAISRPILEGISRRLRYLIEVGLDYLTLDRRARSLSGGEYQRIRLATLMGAGLVGVCYVLDEPTIGLHPRDTQHLIDVMRSMRDAGNTVIVVEHDEAMIEAGDLVVDLGPGAGTEGGHLVSQGSLEDIKACKASLTASYLTGELEVGPNHKQRSGWEHEVEVLGASQNNLKNLDVAFPLGALTCVSGVSGSGKSTLVRNVLFRAVARKIHGARPKPGAHKKLLGADWIDRAIEVDQSPIGRSPRSNPATYTKVFGHIRNLFATLRDSRIRGYDASRFSFNTKGGRCEACQGQGIRAIEMNFLSDVHVICDVCAGKQFNRETLEVRYRGRSIADVLAMPVDEARRFFSPFEQIDRSLRILQEVGLGYLTLGRPSTTLSGGESQRIKLTAELARSSSGHTLYVLDEPTTGLHFADVSRLLSVLDRLVNAGNTVVVIEHNLDIISKADWIIDLGPGGGADGGRVTACGTPQDLADNPESVTGKFLKLKSSERLLSKTQDSRP